MCACVCELDVWSAGCVLAELLLGQPIFPGDSGVDQLVEIIKVLGTPTRDQIREMNPNYQEFKFPQIKAHPWTKVLAVQLHLNSVDSLCLRVCIANNIAGFIQTLESPEIKTLRFPGLETPGKRRRSWNTLEKSWNSKVVVLKILLSGSSIAY